VIIATDNLELGYEAALEAAYSNEIPINGDEVIFYSTSDLGYYYPLAY
jgi:hypothetical protein